MPLLFSRATIGLIAVDGEIRNPRCFDDSVCFGQAHCQVMFGRVTSRYSTRNTFIASSPRWLMIFTAIRPKLGTSNGLDTAEFNVAQASASISAFKVVFNALYGSCAPKKYA